MKNYPFEPRRAGDDEFHFVPEQPPVVPGLFCSLSWWAKVLGGGNRVRSAIKHGALVQEPLGPMNGNWQAVFNAATWTAWASSFNRRAHRMWEGQRAHRVRWALGERKTRA